MQAPPISDAAIARVLAGITAFQDWTNQPLDDPTRHILQQADHQTLMSITAHALRLVMSEDESPQTTD